MSLLLNKIWLLPMLLQLQKHISKYKASLLLWHFIHSLQQVTNVEELTTNVDFSFCRHTIPVKYLL